MLHNGKRLSFEGAPCVVRFVGEVAGTTGSWLGVEWDDPVRGKHDGLHKGHRYFTCKSHSPTSASFIRPTRRPDPPKSFLQALRHKYTVEAEALQQQQEWIVISGKVVEEIGFDKIRRKLARLEDLRVVILDGAGIASADDAESIGATCPSVVELDLSRNLFSELGAVVAICGQLNALRALRLSGNRFTDVMSENLAGAADAFRHVQELALDETLLTWPEICHIACKFPSLESLCIGSNQLSSLPSPTHLSSFPPPTLATLNLEYNNFTTLASLLPLSPLPRLRNLHLKGNRISTIQPPKTTTTTTKPPSSSLLPTVTYLDLSHNLVSTWSFIDQLTTLLPNLTSLRFAHNPIYENPYLDHTSPDEAFMLLLARLPQLTTLNFSHIRAPDRTQAELLYLSRITRQLTALAPNSHAEQELLSRHPRWQELCLAYGHDPKSIRTANAVDENLLEGRLITVRFTKSPTTKQARIPKSLDMYAVKGLVGRLFGLPPLRIALVWETGEWDPVGGNGDEEEGGEEKGHWVKREVELRDGPRLFGHCVDGVEVLIRVEVR